MTAKVEHACFGELNENDIIYVISCNHNDIKLTVKQGVFLNLGNEDKTVHILYNGGSHMVKTWVGLQDRKSLWSTTLFKIDNPFNITDSYVIANRKDAIRLFRKLYIGLVKSVATRFSKFSSKNVTINLREQYHKGMDVLTTSRILIHNS